MGAFTYSQEEDTPATDFPNQVDEEIKEERLDRLMTLQQGISLELNKAKLGKTLEVLVEGYDEEKASCSTAEVAATVLMLTEKYILQRRKKLLKRYYKSKNS